MKKEIVALGEMVTVVGFKGKSSVRYFGGSNRRELVA